MFFLLVGMAIWVVWGTGSATLAAVAPSAPEVSYSQQRMALYSAARVYGKAGCGDFALAEATARFALRAGIPSEIVAAKVAVESSCNPLAVSHKGAVGLTQVMPSIWKGSYDFSRVNLLNPEDSLRVGTEILAGLIAKHGARGGLRRYNGAGPDAEDYAGRVLALAAAGKPGR
jgi:soluble lytic murein transglycosylase-like protein